MLVLLVGGFLHGGRAHGAATKVAEARNRPLAASPAGPASARLAGPLVVVRALGHVGRAHLRHACRTILSRYPVRCAIGRARDVMVARAAWNDARGQVDGRRLLDRLFVDKADALVEVDLTTLDIYEGHRPFVFGLASLSDRVAVISLARVTDDPVEPSQVAATRLRKLILHEVGHALGLGHHDTPTCVMRQDGTPASLDDAPDRLCDTCARALVRRLELLSHPGQAFVDRVRGLLARGDVEAARYQAVRGVHRFPDDAVLLTQLGRAFLDAGLANDAISLLQLALYRDPDLADAHAYRAIALELRGRPADRKEARAHHVRAVELDPRWAAFFGEEAAQGAARAQGPLRHPSWARR